MCEQAFILGTVTPSCLVPVVAATLVVAPPLLRRTWIRRLPPAC